MLNMSGIMDRIVHDFILSETVAQHQEWSYNTIKIQKILYLKSGDEIVRQTPYQEITTNK